MGQLRAGARRLARQLAGPSNVRVICPDVGLGTSTLRDGAVFHDLAHGVVARQSRDAAAGVRRAPGLVKPLERGAIDREPGSRTQVDQLIPRELSVEDVAADEVPSLLHLLGADDLAR